MFFMFIYETQFAINSEEKTDKLLSLFDINIYFLLQMVLSYRKIHILYLYGDFVV